MSCKLNDAACCLPARGRRASCLQPVPAQRPCRGWGEPRPARPPTPRAARCRQDGWVPPPQDGDPAQLWGSAYSRFPGLPRPSAAQVSRPLLVQPPGPSCRGGIQHSRAAEGRTPAGPANVGARAGPCSLPGAPHHHPPEWLQSLSWGLTGIGGADPPPPLVMM